VGWRKLAAKETEAVAEEEEEEESLFKADAVNEGGPWWRSGGCGELAVSRSWAGRLTLHVDQLVHWCWHSFVPCSWSLTVVF